MNIGDEYPQKPRTNPEPARKPVKLKTKAEKEESK